MPALSQASAVISVPTFVAILKTAKSTRTATSIPGPISTTFFVLMGRRYQLMANVQSLLLPFSLLPCRKKKTLAIPPKRRPAETCVSIPALWGWMKRNALMTAVKPVAMWQMMRQKVILGRRVSCVLTAPPRNAIWSPATCGVPRAVFLVGRTSRQLLSSSIHQCRQRSPRSFPLEPIPRRRAVVRRPGRPQDLLWSFRTHAM
mmetsp:Transcript_15504/g.44889  ORF Transcript_15504/g.44889 Transcript_15504/m.44889 type:complete len:203 (-) Transcript_15504:748-1356(-)